jgi:dihydroorotate dehydrogenase (fumarate)
MMDLKTHYLGFDLPHPFMPGASPMVDDLDKVRRMEDAGASAVVLHSLFEEQIVREQVATFYANEPHVESFAEARSYLPDPSSWSLGPDEYLDHVRRVKEAVRVPVIASLNGTTLGGWLHHSALLQEAGADALELNVYMLATDPDESGRGIEDRTVEMLESVKNEIRIPVAVKLSPFYTSLAHFARRLEQAGADAFVLFNRFYQPDLDIEELHTVASLRLSTSAELLLRLRWLAVLSAQRAPRFAISGGVHTAEDAIKAVMAGASAVQMVSVLLKHGPDYIRKLVDEVAQWLEVHEYESLEQMRGSMNLQGCPDPKAYERANYMLVLQGWRSE